MSIQTRVAKIEEKLAITDDEPVPFKLGNEEFMIRPSEIRRIFNEAQVRPEDRDHE